MRQILRPDRERLGQGRNKSHNEAHGSVITKYYSGDHVKGDETGGACGAYLGEEKCILNFDGGKP